MSKNLPLKAVQPYEILICNLTGQHMFCGDWYYEDENGKRYLYEAYHERKKRIKKETFNYDKLCEAKSTAEYKKILKTYQMQVLQDDLDELFEKESE